MPSPISVLIDHSLEMQREIFSVNWNIGNSCNFRCSYCVDNLHNGMVQWLKPDDIIKFADRVIEDYSAKSILFEFTGGEVTLYKDLYNVLKYLKGRNCQTSILSNGSPKLAYWEKIKDVLDYVTLSFHAEHGDPDHFYSVVEYLHQYTLIHVNIMMHNQLFAVCKRLGDKMIDGFSDLSLGFQPLLQSLTNEAKLLDYTEEQMQTIKELDYARERKMNAKKKRQNVEMREYFLDGQSATASPEHFIACGRNRWKGWLCWTGLEQVVVTQEGRVFRAWCLQDSIGDIGEKFKFPTEPVVCTKDQCHCNFDILTKKQRQVYIQPSMIEKMSTVGLLKNRDHEEFS